MRGSEDDLRSAVETAVDSVTEEIGNLRALIVELRPAALDEYGTAAAIESLAERTSAREGMPVEVDVDLSFERGDEADTSHTGAREHDLPARAGGADQRRAACRRDPHQDRTERAGRLRDVAVADDGRGFDPAKTDSGGFGLTGMRERVELADGELDIDSGPQGTTVRARLPVRRRAVTAAG